MSAETTITWDTKPASGQAFATWTAEIDKEVEFDVTRLVEGAWLGDKQLSLRIFAPRMIRGNSFVQYGTDDHTFGTNTRLRWTYSPRGDLFVIYNHNLREIQDRWARDSNELLIKLQYTFRR